MWALNWREMISVSGSARHPDDISMSKFVFDYAGYKKVARINSGLAYEKDFDACVKEFATLFEFEVTELEGTLQLVDNCYAKTKASVLDACPHIQV